MEVKPSVTLVLGATCLWRLSCGFAEGWFRFSVLFTISLDAKHLLKENPGCPFPHVLGFSPLVSYMGEMLNMGGNV